MKRICLLIFSLVLTQFIGAQLKPVHAFLRDDTSLKRKYYDEALQKNSLLVSSLKKENQKDYREAYNSLFEFSGDLLLGPFSVTEPAADQYIKAVVSKIVDANPELKSLDLRVVFSRDIAPNAYSIGDGTIAFNAGLFVFLDNEAQMAFTICHELAHYYMNHSLKRIEKNIKLYNSDSLKKELKNLSRQQYGIGAQLDRMIKNIFFDIFRHSREGEVEADRVGMRFFRKTGYDGEGILSTLQLLDRVDDTSFFRPLDLPKVLSFPGYPFKDRWIKQESMIFGSMKLDEATGLTKKERDSLKTHPDCSKRISLLADSATTIKGKQFLVNEATFKKLKEDFIPEMVEQVYKSGNISFNLYLSLRMLQEGRHIPLATYSIARALNKIYQHQKDHELGLIIDSENRFYNEDYNLLLRMLYRLRLHEIAEINAEFCSAHEQSMKDYEGFREEMKKAKNYRLTHQ